MKFSSAPFFVLASLLAVTSALPTDDSVYNGGPIHNNAAIVARNAETLPDGFVSAASLNGNSTSLKARGGYADDILSLGFEAAIGGFQNLAKDIKQDKVNRSAFTQKVVGDLSNKDPSFNYVICHTKHDAKWDGVEGVDWSHRHQEFDIQVGGTVGYEIYAARSGQFTRQGDGGFLNWAYVGNVQTNDQGGKHLVFARP